MRRSTLCGNKLSFTDQTITTIKDRMKQHTENNVIITPSIKQTLHENKCLKM